MALVVAAAVAAAAPASAAAAPWIGWSSSWGDTPTSGIVQLHYSLESPCYYCEASGVLEYGATEAYGATVPFLAWSNGGYGGSGSGQKNITITGLSPSMTYYWRATLTNTWGTSTPETGSFTTPKPATAPACTDASASTVEDTAVSSAVACTDAENDALTYSVAAQPQHGTLGFSTDGAWTYTPAADWSGTDSFTFKARDSTSRNSNVSTQYLTVSSVNDPPRAQADSVSAGGGFAFLDPLANDAPGPADESAQQLSLRSLGTPAHGKTTLVDGSVRYAPTPGYTGSDSFSYEVCDDGSPEACATGTVAVTVTTPARPANDDWRQAGNRTCNGEVDWVALGRPQWTFCGTNAGATKEAGEPDHAGRTGGSSVWFRFTAPRTGPVGLDTAGSDFDTLLAVYTVRASQDWYDVSQAVRVASNDDTAGGSTSALSFDAVAGTAYRVAVDGAGGATGNIVLHGTFPSDPPPNDDIADAAPLLGESGSVEGDEWLSTWEPGESALFAGGEGIPGQTVWYRWISAQPRYVTFSLGAGAEVAAFTGTSVADMTRVALSTDHLSPRISFDAAAGTEYRIAVEGESPFTLTWGTATAAPAANDLWPNASRISGGSGVVTGSTAGTVPDTFATEPAGRAVWYRWRAPTGGDVTFDLAGSDYDTLLEVSTTTLGTVSGSSLVRPPVATNDDDGPSPTSRVSFHATAGTEYLLAVDGHDGAVGSHRLAWSFTSPALPNDDFADAQELAGQQGEVDGATYPATAEPGEPVQPANSVWYRWMPGAGSASLAVPSDTFEGSPSVAVFTGAAVNALTRVSTTGNGGTSLSFAAGDGTTYWIAVGGGYGDFTLRWHGPQAPRPENDDWADATEVPPGGGSFAEQTFGATREAGERDFWHNGGPTVWFHWRAPTMGSVVVDTSGSDMSPEVMAYSGTSVSTLTSYDNLCYAWRTSCWFTATAGEDLWFQLESRTGGTGLAKFALSFSATANPYGDTFPGGGITGLSGSSGTAAANTNFAATKQPGEPDHGADAGGHSVWYTWTAPATRPVTFTSAGSNFDAVVALYTGSSVDALTAVASSAPGSAEVTFDAVRDTTYRIAVDGRGGAQGDVTLAWSMPAPANDAFAAAETLSGRDGTAEASLLRATGEPGEPSICGGPRRSVWYRWTAPADGTMAVTPSGHPFADGGGFTSTLLPALGVYTGDAVGALTHVTHSCAWGTIEPVPFTAVAGTTYWISVDTANGGNGSVTLTWLLSSVPTNLTPPAISGDPALGATLSAAPGDWGGYPAPTRSYTWQWEGGGSWHDIGLATGTTLELDRAWLEGARIRVVEAATNASGTATAVSQPVGPVVGPREPPANDAFDHAQTIAGEHGGANGWTFLATTEPGEPAHASLSRGATVWYAWTPPRSGRAVVSATASDRAFLAVYTGTSLGSLTQVALDDAGYSGHPTVSFAVAGGTTYHIARGELWTDTAAFTLGWQLTPGNDDFVSADALAADEGSVTASNAFATAQAGEPADDWSPAFRSLWYSWSPSRLGEATLTLSGSSQIRLAAYAGDSFASLTKLASAYVSTGNGSAQIRFRAVPGTTYRVSVDTFAPYTGTELTLAWQLGPAPPPNDQIVDAIPLRGDADSLDGTTLGATHEPGEPRVYDNLDSSVWYAFTPDAGGSYRIGATGDNLTLRVWSGTAPALAAVASEWLPQDGGGYSYTLTARRTYLISVDSLGDGGPFTLRWQPTPPPTPANDAYGSAQAIDGHAGKLSGTTRSATAQTWEPARGGEAPAHSVWYLWRAPATGDVTFSAESGGFHPVVGVYVPDPSYTVAEVAASAQGRVSFRASEGTYYSVAVDGRGGASGDFDLTWDEPRPANDLFADGQPLDGSSGEASGDTTGSTRETGEPAPAGFTGARGSVWYRWRAPARGWVVFEASSADLDPVVGVYTGDAVDALTLVRDSSARPAAAGFAAVAGGEYRIEVTGRNGIDAALGGFRLSWSTPSGAYRANDDLADAAPLTGLSGSIAGSTLPSSHEPGEPQHAGEPGGQSVWYRWQAPADGRATFSTSGSAFDTVLAAYTGTAVDALTPVAANDDADGVASRVGFDVQAGRVYVLAVDGHGGLAGALSLSWSVELPDLVVASVTAPDDLVAGGLLHASASVRNAGAFASPATSAALFLLQDGSRLRLGGADVPALAAGAAAEVLFDVTLPPEGVPGAAEIALAADDGAAAVEADETNNELVRALRLLEPDVTPPTITPHLAGTLGEGDWYTSDVDVSWEVADPESPIVTSVGCDPSTVTTDGAALTLTCWATSRGGTGTESVTFSRDATPPAVTGAATRPPDANGWYNRAVDVRFEGVDDGSGVDSCTTNAYAGPDAALGWITGTCTDAAGNIGTGAAAVPYDATGPTAAAALARGPDSGAWFNHAVGAVVSGLDALSGLDSCSALPDYAGPDSDAASVAGVCRDRAGNETAAATTFAYDATPPLVGYTLDRPPDQNGWYSAPVGGHATAADATSGVTGCAEPDGYAGPDTADATLATRCRDEAGNEAAASTTFRYDATAPIDVTVTLAREPDSGGWYNRPVPFQTSGGDATSGIASCTRGAYAGPDGDRVVATGSCTDAAGNAATASALLAFDATAPEMTLTPVRPPDHDGWYNRTVAAVAAGEDATSGGVACSQPEPYTGPDDATAALHAACVDAAGNAREATLSFAYDATAPVGVATALAREPDSEGWFNHPVGWQTSGDDATSGIDSCDSGTYTGPDSGAASVGGGCLDRAGNRTTSPPAPLRYDATAPTGVHAVPERAPDHAGWYNHPLAIGFAADDALSGVETCTATGYHGPDDAHATVAGNCTDHAGNNAPAGIELAYDATAPPLAVTTPALQGDYVLAALVPAAFACGPDPVSGIATCDGSAAAGAPLDTAAVGPHTFHALAVDGAGNRTSADVPYDVVYAAGACLDGPGRTVLSPIDAGGGSVFNGGRNVTVKFRVCDASGRAIGAPGVVSRFTLVRRGAQTVSEQPASTSSPHPQFRWDAGSSQWVFDLSTKGLAPGLAYGYSIDLADGTSIPFGFSLR